VRNVVLDTSIFVNPDARGVLGDTPTLALQEFLSMIHNIEGMEFYMPPSIFEELMNFIKRDEIPAELLLKLNQKSPRRLETSVPGQLLYELVDEMRDRVNKGLRIAEKAVRSTERLEIDDIVKDMRRKYRDALREGVIDSAEDMDLILLARELDAVLVTADQGACKWADKLGVQWLFPERFKDYVLAHIEDNSRKESVNSSQ
jgi:RNA ligase partner protein